MKPYYEHAGITIYHGDCREVLPLLCADCIVADPPYGIGKDYGEASTDDLDTFRAAVEMIADFGKPASICLYVSQPSLRPAKALEQQGIHADYFYRGKANGAAERHYGYKHCVLFGADSHWSEVMQGDVEGMMGYVCANDWRGPYVIVNRR